MSLPVDVSSMGSVADRSEFLSDFSPPRGFDADLPGVVELGSFATNVAPFERAPTQYCNVDLDIVSRVSLDGLVQAFGEDVVVLYVGGEGRSYEAHLELAYRHPARTAERAITRFVRLIKRRMISGRLPHDRARPSNASPGGDGPGAG